MRPYHFFLSLRCFRNGGGGEWGFPASPQCSGRHVANKHLQEIISLAPHTLFPAFYHAFELGLIHSSVGDRRDIITKNVFFDVEGLVVFPVRSP